MDYRSMRSIKSCLQNILPDDVCVVILSEVEELACECIGSM